MGIVHLVRAELWKIVPIGIISLVLPLSAQTPKATLSTHTLYLGLVPIGGFSTANVTLSNAGTSALIVSSIDLLSDGGGQITQTNTCNSSLGPGASCIIALSYRPRRSDLAQGYLSIVDNDPTQIQLVGAGGVGAGKPLYSSLLLVNGDSVLFGEQPIFTQSPPWTVTVVNRTESDLPFAYDDFQHAKDPYALHAGTPSDFQVMNNCPNVILSHTSGVSR